MPSTRRSTLRTFGRRCGRIAHVGRLCLRELAHFPRWGLLWPAFLAAAIVLLVSGSARERSLAIATSFATIVLAVPFLFTTWPLDLHVRQAYFRLLAQLGPAAIAVVILGYARARGWTADDA